MRPINKYYADDVSVAIRIRYKGSLAVAQLLVTTNGDIYFYKSSTAATATLDGNVDGPSNGFIDVSNASYNTWGEVVDYINTLTDWEAVLIDVERSFVSDNRLNAVTRTADGVMTPGGKELKNRTSTGANQTEITAAVTLIDAVRPAGNAIKKTDENLLIGDAKIKKIVSKNTFSVGNNKIQVYEGDVLVREVDGGATTVEQTLDWSLAPFVSSKKGKKLTVRMKGSSRCTGYLNVQGEVGGNWEDRY